MANSCFMFIYRIQMAVKWALARGDNFSADFALVQFYRKVSLKLIFILFYMERQNLLYFNNKHIQIYLAYLV